MDIIRLSPVGNCVVNYTVPKVVNLHIGNLLGIAYSAQLRTYQNGQHIEISYIYYRIIRLYLSFE
jgi:hypothetical protein